MREVNHLLHEETIALPVGVSTVVYAMGPTIGEWHPKQNVNFAPAYETATHAQ